MYNETYHKRQELLGEEEDYAGETGTDDQRTVGSQREIQYLSQYAKLSRIPPEEARRKTM